MKEKLLNTYLKVKNVLSAINKNINNIHRYAAILLAIVGIAIASWFSCQSRALQTKVAKNDEHNIRNSKMPFLQAEYTYKDEFNLKNEYNIIAIKFTNYGGNLYDLKFVKEDGFLTYDIKKKNFPSGSTFPQEFIDSVSYKKDIAGMYKFQYTDDLERHFAQIMVMERNPDKTLNIELLEPKELIANK